MPYILDICYQTKRGDSRVLVLEYKAVVKPIQAKFIDEAIRTSQFARNKVLRYWMNNRGFGKKELYQYNTQLRAEFDFVKDLNSHAYQASVENVERAIKRFFDNCKKKKPGKKGYPRFKNNCHSVEYKQSGWKLNPSKRRINFIDKKGIGEVKLLGKWDIHTYPVELIKRVRIVRRADGYYVQFCVKVDNQQSCPVTTSEVGIDVGLEYFYSDSNGNHEENPRYLRFRGERYQTGATQNIQKEKAVIWQKKSAWYLCSETFESNKTKE